VRGTKCLTDSRGRELRKENERPFRFHAWQFRKEKKSTVVKIKNKGGARRKGKPDLDMNGGWARHKEDEGRHGEEQLLRREGKKREDIHGRNVVVNRKHCNPGQ